MHDQAALMFYSPFDKTGLVFKKNQHDQMLGRKGLPSTYKFGSALVKVRTFNANEGNLFRDVWHVKLMGWNYPGMIFKSRYIKRWNNSKTLLGAGITLGSFGPYIQVKEGHIKPIWSTIAKYITTGEIPDTLPLPEK